MVDVFRCANAAVYHNTGRLTPAQIREKTGCTHIVNGYFFNSKFTPLGWLVIDGKVISSDKWNDFGFAVGKDGLPTMSTDRSNTFLGCVPLLKDGKKLSRGLTPDVARKAERTAVGWTADGKVVLWCDKATMKMDALQNLLLEHGCVDGMAMDGGGSTQGIFPSGKVTSSRKVPTFLLFWKEQNDNEPKGEKPMVEINAYSLKKDGNKNLTAHFKVKEFACKDGTDTVFIARELPVVCEYIRMRCNKGITVNSAYRTPAHNKKEGGVDNSQHLYGTAADLKTPSGYTPAKLASIAREIMPNWGGVGIYTWGIHVDVRETKSDWKG